MTGVLAAACVAAQTSDAEIACTTLSFRLANGPYRPTGRPGLTLGCLINLEAPPQWIRFIFLNDTRLPWTLDAACFATTSLVGDGISPYSASGAVDPGAWRPVTFDGGGRPDSALVRTAGAVGAFTMAADRGPPAQPAQIFSDWLPAVPTQRGDGGFGGLVLMRAYASGVQRFTVAEPPDPTLRRNFAWFGTAGNGCVPPFRFRAQPFRGSPIHGVQFVSARPGATVIGIGDSIMSSLKTTGGDSGLGVRACILLSRPWHPVSYFNEAFSGRLSADFCTNGIAQIRALQPQVALIQCWSENDMRGGGGMTASNACFARAMQVVDVARQNHCRPILLTAAPCFGRAPGQEKFRTANNERVRAMAHDFPVLDLDAIWGAGTQPNTYRPGFDSGDFTHPTDAACQAAAHALAPMIEALL